MITKQLLGASWDLKPSKIISYMWPYGRIFFTSLVAEGTAYSSSNTYKFSKARLPFTTQAFSSISSVALEPILVCCLLIYIHKEARFAVYRRTFSNDWRKIIHNMGYYLIVDEGQKDSMLDMTPGVMGAQSVIISLHIVTLVPRASWTEDNLAESRDWMKLDTDHFMFRYMLGFCVRRSFPKICVAERIESYCTVFKDKSLLYLLKLKEVLRRA